MKDIVTKASKVFDLYDFKSNTVFTENFDGSLLDSDKVYDEILKPFANTVDASKIKGHKYCVETIEPYNQYETTDAISEVSIALFDVTEFKLVFYYRVKFIKLTLALIDFDYGAYEQDSVYYEFINYVQGYRRITKDMTDVRDRVGYYLSQLGIDNKDKALSFGVWCSEFTPFLFPDEGAIYIGKEKVMVPEKYQKYMLVKYPYKHSVFLGFVKKELIKILSS